jgi:hypothetical protein
MIILSSSIQQNLIEYELIKALESSGSELAKHIRSKEPLDPLRSVEDLYNVYSCCFCEEGDKLSQWRAYTENSTGYSIGFYAASLPQTQVKGTFKQVLKKVVYTREDQINSVRPAIETCLEDAIKRVGPLLPIDKEDRHKVVVGFFADFYKSIFRFLYSFKDPAFSEEKEWRVVLADINNANLDKVPFREMRGTIVPYVEMPLSSLEPVKENHLPIVEIIQGPLVDPALGEKSLKMLLKKCDYNNVKIRQSEVPIRF